jgi:ribosomal protein S18 acetylase RimI-like enzyme
MTVRVRRASVDDGQAVADVLNSVIAEGKYTILDRAFSVEEERDFIAAMARRKAALYVAEIDGQIVGIQSIDLFSDHADSVRHVATVGTWLRREFRGRGIGRLLAEESFRFARSHGYTKIMIQVLAHNDAALRFYRSLGFQEIGIAKRHVRLAGNFHDEVFLEMPL